MATINFSGWLTGDFTEMNASGGTLSVQTTVKRTGGYALRINPSAGTGYVSFGNPDGTNLSGTTWYQTVYFYIATTASADNSPVARCGSGAASVAQVLLNTDRTLHLTGATSSGNTSAISTGTWNRLDILWVQNGTCSLSLNGETAVTCTGSNNAPVAVYCGSRVTSVTYDCYFDDMFLSTTAFPGAGEVHILKPNGTGNYTAWADSAGTAPTNVAEVPHDSDTGYISTATLNDAETETMDSASTGGVAGAIAATKVLIVTRDDIGAGQNRLNARIRSGSTDSDGAYKSQTTSYSPNALISEVDPSTTAAWTLSGIDGIEAGVVLTAHISGIARCTAIYVMVWCSGPNPQSVTPTTASLTTATFAPTIRLNKIATPSTLATVLSSFAPTVLVEAAGITVTPGVAALVLAAFAPTTRLDMLPTPSTLATVLATFAPTVVNPQSATPGTLATLLASFTPTVSVGQYVTPDVASLVLTTFDPAVINPMSATPDTLALTLTTFEPVASVGQIVTPDTLALLTVAFAPLILLPQSVTPDTLALLLTGFAPTIINPQSVTPATLALVLTGFEPTVAATLNMQVTPGPGSLVIATFAPSVIALLSVYVMGGVAILVPGPEAGAACLSSRILHGSAAFDPRPAAGAAEMGLAPRAGSAAYDRPEPGSAAMRSP